MKEYKIKCTNCEKLYIDDDDLEIQKDGKEYYKGCSQCKTDNYLMDF